MTSRTFSCTLLLALGCGSAAPSVERVSIAQPVVTAAAPTGPAIPSDPEMAYALGLRWWTTGRKDDALRALRAARQGLLRADAHRTLAPGTLGDPVREGEWLVVPVAGGGLVASAKTGAFERYVPLEVATATPLGAGLVGVPGAGVVTLLDVASGESVARIEGGSGIARGARVFAVDGSRDGVPFVELWDTAARKRLRGFDTQAVFALTLELADSDRVVVALDSNRTLAWDASTGAKLLDYTTVGTPSAPAFSADGRFVAYGKGVVTTTSMQTTTVLADRKSGKVVATSRASQYPTSPAFAGKWLAIGDLRKACLLEVPSLRLVACSAELRASYGPDDDLQNADPTFVSDGRALVITTADGVVLVAGVPSMKTLWTGSGHPVVGPNGTIYVPDDVRHRLYAIGAGGAVTDVRPLEEEDQMGTLRETLSDEQRAALTRIRSRACHIDGWVFPAEACGRLHT